eukprot:TRINITY_DN13768_c0_g1_i1.p1 TRINITY_DN13768_c0_g1~~TRINITY_DN13768_c0_g1_i1.p1  ORF type:complete len:904 (+),score=146.75 TRINITY_DN13768_c0_g1_i1:97-2808(+)
MTSQSRTRAGGGRAVQAPFEGLHTQDSLDFEKGEPGASFGPYDTGASFTPGISIGGVESPFSDRGSVRSHLSDFDGFAKYQEALGRSSFDGIRFWQKPQVLPSSPKAEQSPGQGRNPGGILASRREGASPASAVGVAKPNDDRPAKDSKLDPASSPFSDGDIYGVAAQSSPVSEHAFGKASPPATTVASKRSSVPHSERSSLKSVRSRTSVESDRFDDVPLLLIVRQSESCDGEYNLVKGKNPNGYPLWKHARSPLFIFGGPSYRWFIGGEDEYNEDFAVNTGYIGTKDRHDGFYPHEIPVDGWKEYIDDLDDWYDLHLTESLVTEGIQIDQLDDFLALKAEEDYQDAAAEALQLRDRAIREVQGAIRRFHVARRDWHRQGHRKKAELQQEREDAALRELQAAMRGMLSREDTRRRVSEILEKKRAEQKWKEREQIRMALAKQTQRWQREQKSAEEREREKAALRLQAVWRGLVERRRVEAMREAKKQRLFRQQEEKRDWKVSVNQKLKKAHALLAEKKRAGELATKIQSIWRGNRVRRDFQSAMKQGADAGKVVKRGRKFPAKDSQLADKDQRAAAAQKIQRRFRKVLEMRRARAQWETTIAQALELRQLEFESRQLEFESRQLEFKSRKEQWRLWRQANDVQKDQQSSQQSHESRQVAPTAQHGREQALSATLEELAPRGHRKRSSGPVSRSPGPQKSAERLELRQPRVPSSRAGGCLGSAGRAGFLPRAPVGAQGPYAQAPSQGISSVGTITAEEPLSTVSPRIQMHAGSVAVSSPREFRSRTPPVSGLVSSTAGRDVQPSAGHNQSMEDALARSRIGLSSDVRRDVAAVASLSSQASPRAEAFVRRTISPLETSVRVEGYGGGGARRTEDQVRQQVKELGARLRSEALARVRSEWGAAV